MAGCALHPVLRMALGAAWMVMLACLPSRVARPWYLHFIIMMRPVHVCAKVGSRLFILVLFVHGIGAFNLSLVLHISS